jgi:pSer/pThr/pTyr-binding forkhead associated (FHA) protein
MNQLSIDRLQEACGTAGQLRAGIEWEGKSEVVEKSFFLPCLLAGRDPNTDLSLDDAQVSQRHAFFQILGGRLFAVDLRSRTGTHWESGSKNSGWVEPGEAIRIGPFRLRFSGDGLKGTADAAGDWNPLDSPAPELANLADVALEFLQGPTRPMTWHVNQALTLIGRCNDCGICLRDQSVSFFHGYLLRTPAGTWVVDLFSRGGILLNGRRVRWGRVDAGDQLQVGNFLLRSRPEGPFHAARPREAVEEPHAGVPHELGENGSHPETRNGSEATATTPRVGGPVVPAGRSLDRTSLQEAILTPLVNQFAALQGQMVAQFQQSILMMVDRFREMHREQFGLIRQEVDRLHQITEELQALQAQADKQPRAATTAAHPAVPSAAPTSQPATAATAPEPAVGPLVSSKLPPLQLPQPKADPDDGAVHIWLYDRITQLQRERQSTLKKILNFLAGK